MYVGMYVECKLMAWLLELKRCYKPLLVSLNSQSVIGLYYVGPKLAGVIYCLS